MRSEPALVDLSHTVEHGMITYPGLPGPVVSAHLDHAASREHYAGGTEFHIGRIEMVANTGTYLDSPFHRHAGAPDLSELPLRSLADLPGTLIEAADAGSGGVERAIAPGAFAGRDLEGRAVLVHTGWDAHWGTDRYFEGHPFLTREAAEHLAASGAALVGIDSLNIDDTDDGERPVHTILLDRGIPVVEHLCRLERLRGRAFRFSAVPVKVKGLGSFPVRAFAALERESGATSA